MHEYSIVASLIDRVTREVVACGATRVHRLHVDIGELSGVETELLATAFDTFRDGTSCDGAELEIHPVAARWECPTCAQVLERGAILRCPECGNPARLAAGDDIILARIEMEVPDV